MLRSEGKGEGLEIQSSKEKPRRAKGSGNQQASARFEGSELLAEIVVGVEEG